MTTFSMRTSLALLAGLALTTSTAHAQVYGQAFPNTANYINPNPYLAQGLKLNQFAYNTAVLGRAYSQIPPWLYGYNPYPSPIYSPGYNQPYPTPYAAPYANPYGGGYGAGGYAGGYGATNPYGGGYSPGGGGYTSGGDPYNPYSAYADPYGGYLRGQADVMKAYGTVALNLEQARLARELVNQAKLETKKKALETANWIRDNTLTWSQEQERSAAQTLRRVLSAATQAEILSGKAQNLLLKDLAKIAKKGATQPVVLEEDVVKQLNVTGTLLADANLGLLRNNGSFTWPAALKDLSPHEHEELLKSISLETSQAYRQAIDAKLNPQLVRNLRSRMDKLRDELAAKVNEIPIAQTLESKRFLNDFNDAIVALEKGDAVVAFDFQKNFTGGGKTVAELVDYMTRRGLRFAPAVSGDESAYQAIQTALANYDLSLGGGANPPSVSSTLKDQ